MIDLLESVWWYCNAGVQMYGHKAWCLVGIVEKEFLHISCFRNFMEVSFILTTEFLANAASPPIENFR